MPQILLEHVSKRFEKFVAVDDLNLEISDRGFVTLLGPSGCGKTTTLRMIAGLETPTSGRILIDGVPVFDSEKGINLPPNKRDIGFLFQNYALWPHMTVEQNISFGLEMLKWDKERIRKRVDEMLALLKIEQFGKRYRRPAAARRHRADPGPQPEGALHGRAAVQPGREAAGRDAHRAQAPPQRYELHLCVCHP